MARKVCGNLEVIGAPENLRIVLTCFPPSSNSIWRRVGNRTLLSEKAREYYATQPWIIKAQARHVTLTQDVHIQMELIPPNRRRWDLDNRAKTVLDCLVKSGVLSDDDAVVRLTLIKSQPDPTWKQGGVIIYASEETGLASSLEAG